MYPFYEQLVFFHKNSSEKSIYFRLTTFTFKLFLFPVKYRTPISHLFQNFHVFWHFIVTLLELHETIASSDKFTKLSNRILTKIQSIFLTFLSLKYSLKYSSKYSSKYSTTNSRSFSLKLGVIQWLDDIKL